MTKKGEDEDEHPRRRDVPPKQEPTATPLVSSADVPLTHHPVQSIPSNRYDVLCERARRIADSWRGSPENHIAGTLGEDGFARQMGIEDELNVEVYSDGGDGGKDFVYRGATVDVKTVGRHRSDPALTVNTYELLNADYYVLASRIGPTDVRLIGYAPRIFVANAPTFVSDGQPYHVVNQEYLFPFPDIS
jgi:hypothetical protein